MCHMKLEVWFRCKLHFHIFFSLKGWKILVGVHSSGVNKHLLKRIKVPVGLGLLTLGYILHGPCKIVKLTL